MKITCTNDEYAILLRTCDHSLTEFNCRGCVMANICMETVLEDAVEITVEEDAE